MKKLLKYDFFYLWKTQKFTVFAGVFIFFSILSPLTARYLREILEYFLGEEGLGLPIPDPDVYSAYGQYISDMFETVFFVILFVAVAVFIRDKTKGLAQLVFSKPINRTQYLLSKYITFLVLVIAATLVGYLVFSYYTYFLFEEVFIAKGLGMMALFVLYIAFISSVALFAAVYMSSYLTAVVVTFGAYILFSILTILDQVAIIKYFPGTIIQSISNILMDVADTGDVVWNIVFTLLFTGVFLGLAIHKVQQQDI